MSRFSYLIFFFFNDPATTEISPLPLHDALPIWIERVAQPRDLQDPAEAVAEASVDPGAVTDAVLERRPERAPADPERHRHVVEGEDGVEVALDHVPGRPRRVAGRGAAQPTISGLVGGRHVVAQRPGHVEGEVGRIGGAQRVALE